MCNGELVCGAPGPGDACDDPLALSGALPIEVVGTTALGAGDDFTICSDETDVFGFPMGADAPDIVLQYTPATTADYVISVPTALDGDPSLLSITTSCADLAGTCVFAQDLFETDDGSVTVRLDAGVSYYLVLDGYFGGGTYILYLDIAP